MPHFFERTDRWGNGLALWVVVGMAFLIPLSLWSLRQIHMENEVHTWISKDNLNYREYEWYKSYFPAEDTILLTWDGNSLGDPRVERLAAKLRGAPTADGGRRGGSRFIERVRTPGDLIAQIEKSKIPQEEAIRRVEGVLIGAGPLRIRLTETGRARKDQFIQLLREQARQQLRLDVGIRDDDAAEDALLAGAISDAADAPADADAPDMSSPPDDSRPPDEPSQDASAGAAAEETPPPAASEVYEVPPHDLAVTWPGMHWRAEELAAVKELSLGLRFPAAGDATKLSHKPLVEECFQVPGAPVALALYLSEAGKADRQAAFRELEASAVALGIPADSLHLGGSAVAGAALNREVVKAAWDKSAPIWQLHRRSLVLLSGLVGGLLAFWALRSLKLAALVLGISYFTALLSTALVPVTGGSMNMVLVVMPTLLFVTTLSVAIHLANYWQHAAASDPRTAVVAAFKTALVPCLWAGLTSAIGQASLMTSSLTPVRDFGLYSAIGTLISLVVALYGLPALLQLFPSRAPRAEDLDNAFWHALAARVARRHHLVWITSLVLSAACMYGLRYFQTETKVIRYFADSTRTVRDYNYIEDHLAGIIPVDVIVRFDSGAQSQLKFLERRELVRTIEQAMERLPDISGTLSLSDFLPDEPAPGPGASKPRQVKYAAASRTIETRVKKGEQAGARTLLAVADQATDFNAAGDELWRITAQVAIMSDLNYADLRKQLDAICMTALRGVSGDSPEKLPDLADGRSYHPGASHVVTGMIPLFLATQQELLESFIWSFVGAFGSIALVVMLVLRHPLAGLLAMIPNVLPIGAVFGIVSWCGVHVDMGSTVTASIALGITIDGTLHLITWFRLGIQQGKSRAEAVAQALGHCGPAMWQTTLVVSLGLLMLYPSDLVLISRFGWLMAALLAAASVTDLVLTPALLAGPLGYLIQRVTPAPPGAATADGQAPEQGPAARPEGESSGVLPGKPHLEKRGVRIRRVD